MMPEHDGLIDQMQGTVSRLTTALQSLEVLMQDAVTVLGSRGVQFSLQADDLFAEMRQNLDLEGHYMKQLDNRLARSSELVRVGSLLSSSLNLEHVLQEVMDAIIHLTHAARAYLVLREDDALTVRIARNWDGQTLPEDEILFSRGIIQAALASAEVIVSANVQNDARFKNLASVLNYQLYSIVCIPLLARGNTIGAIYADSGAKTAPFNADLVPTLVAFANQAAIAIDNARLFELSQAQAEAVQRSREQIITAREEERRRLRRDLHDGLGPILGSFTLKIDAVRKQIKQKPELADATLLELKNQVKNTIQDVRRIVYDLRPPALDELGLLGALHEHAQHLAGLQVEITAPEPLPPLPAAVEVAVYRIALEALTNVTKHAHAERCSIRLQVDQAVTLEISDDGCGMPIDQRVGVGMTAMRERAAELGGTCTIESSPASGTHLQVLLPL